MTSPARCHGWLTVARLAGLSKPVNCPGYLAARPCGHYYGNTSSMNSNCSEEYPVPRPAENVIRLRPTGALRAKAVPGDLPVPLRRLGAAAKELDDLGHHLDRIVRDPRWSALEWRAACSPLLVQLSGIRQSLTDLGQVRVGQWPDTGWAVRFRASLSEVERRLADVRISMSALADEETSSADAVVTFSSDATLLAVAARELHRFIADRYPAAVAAR